MTKKKPTIDEILNTIQEAIYSCDISGCVEAKVNDYHLVPNKYIRFIGSRADDNTQRPVPVNIVCNYTNRDGNEEPFFLNIHKYYYDNYDSEIKSENFYYKFADKSEYYKIVDRIDHANKQLWYRSHRYQRLNNQIHQILQLTQRKINLSIRRNEGKESLVLGSKIHNRFLDKKNISAVTVLDFDNHEHLDYLVKYILEYVMNVASVSEGDILYIVHKFLNDSEPYKYHEGKYQLDNSLLWYGSVEDSNFRIGDE